MHKDKFVFSQLIVFLDRNKFNYIVRKHDGDKYVKHFTCWNQLQSLMFGKLSNHESLRDLIIALDVHHSKCYHLGIGRNVSRSSLARANQDRDYHIFDRAYNNFKMLYKVHQIEAFFVVVAKKNLQYKSIKWKRILG